MRLVITLLFTVISLAALIFISQKTVKILSKLSAYYQLSGTFVGLTVFSVATSLPEIISALVASTKIISQTLPYEVASAAVVAGNVGSDVFQQTIMLAVVAIISAPLYIEKIAIKHALNPLIIVSFILLLLSLDGTLSKFDGFILLALFVSYTLWLYVTDVRKAPTHKQSKNPVKDLAYLVFALVALVFSAHILFISINDVVQITGVDASLIGVLALGLGAASPELAAALAAAKQNKNDISVGILLGSNITNPTLALGLGAILSTYSIAPSIVNLDLVIKLFVPILLLVIFTLQKKPKINKPIAIMLITTYLLYIASRIYLYGFQ